MELRRRGVVMTGVLLSSVLVAAVPVASVTASAAAATAQHVSPSARRGAERSAPVRKAYPISVRHHMAGVPGQTQFLLGRLPLSFVPNRGQAPTDERFLAHGTDYTLALSAQGATLTLAATRPVSSAHGMMLRPHGTAPASLPSSFITALRLTLVGANPRAALSPQQRLPGYVNYLIGRDRRHWQTHVPTYAVVVAHNVYPGIDLVYYGTGTHLEYDWRLAPGADPRRIRLRVQSLSDLDHHATAIAAHLDEQGNLVLRGAAAAFVQQVPRVYQQQGSRTQRIAAHYVWQHGLLSLALGSYNRQQALLIDPVLSYATYLGGSGSDAANGVAVDSSGNIYVVGGSGSTDFPVQNAYQAQLKNANGCAGVACNDLVLTKFNPSGTALLYSTYFGGSGAETGYGVQVDSSGNAYVVGQTQSITDFPTTSNAYQSSNGATNINCGTANNNDAFLSKFSSSGTTLLYSSFLGGCLEEKAIGVALDTSGHAYMTGYTYSTNFPTKNAYQSTSSGGQHAFVAEFDTTASTSAASLLYSTYLEGDGSDVATGIAVDSAGNAYVTGSTTSSHFPTVPGSFQTSYGGNGDAFVTKLASSGSSLVYSTYAGRTGNEQAMGIALDSSNNVYVTGDTTGTDFITTTGSMQPSFGGGSDDAFVFSLNAAGTALRYSTYLGGNDTEEASGIAVDSSGTAYAIGHTFSRNFPTQAAFQPEFAGGDDTYVSALDSSGALVWSSYLGGSAGDSGNAITVDSSGTVYVVGSTLSTDFPVTPNAYQSHLAGTSGYTDSFVAKIGGARSAGGGTSGTVPWHPHHTFGGGLGNGIGLSVDLADGHADVSIPALSIPGRGPDLSLSATWDSILAGSGITTTAHPAIQSYLTQKMSGVLTGTVVYTDATGAVWDFPFVGSATASPPYTTYRTPPGQPWQLTTSTSGYTLTDILSGESWTFNSQGQIVADGDAYSNSNVVNYSGGAPISETNSGGRSLYFGYAGGHFSTIQSPLAKATGNVQGQLVAYGYNSANQMTSVSWGYTSPDQVSATFGYSGTQLVTVTTGITGSNPGKAWIITYDGLGRVSYVTSPASGTVGQVGYTPNYATVFAYNPGQTVVSEGYNTSGQLNTIYTLDAQGQPLAVTDGLLHSTYYGYDADHDITGTQDANGNITYNYYQYVGPNGSTGLVTATVEAPVSVYTTTAPLTPITTTHQYDPSTNDLISTTLPGGGIDKYGYDGHHSVITTTELVTGTTQWRGSINQLDSYGEMTGTVDGRGVSVDGTGNASLKIQASQYTQHTGYDTQGDVTSESTAPITTTLNGSTTTNVPVTTTFGYDADGNQTSIISANGQTTTYGYDHLGRPITTTLPAVTLYNNTVASPVVSTTYDAQGNITRTVDANGNATLSSYDPLGRQVSQTNPVSGTTIMTYSATTLSQQRDPQGNVSSYGYDVAGRLITATAPISGVETYGYDPAGNTTAVTITDVGSGAILQVETRQYDAQNRVITDSVTAPGQPTTSTVTTYDADSNAVQVVNPNGDVVVSTYDKSDQLVQTATNPSPLSGPGQTAATLDQNYGYDAAGNLITSTDADGRTLTTTFDGDSRPTLSIATGGGATPITTTVTYDPDGNTLTGTTQASDANGLPQVASDTSSVNPTDWLTSTVDSAPGVVPLTTTYGYDAGGNQRSESILNGAATITTTYDANNRPTSIAENVGGAPYTSNFSYDLNDQPLTATLANTVQETRRYDANSRLTHLGALGPGGVSSPLNNAYDYGYNAAGWTTQISTTLSGVAGTETITHDALGRVSGDNGGANGPETWSYDKNGNILSNVENGATTVFTYSATQPNQEVAQHTDGRGVEYFQYDKHGNTVSMTSTDATNSIYYVNTHLTYDALSRPISITLKDGSQVAFGYNSDGARSSYSVITGGVTTRSEHFSYRAGGTLGQVVVVSGTQTYTDTYLYTPEGAPLELLRQYAGQAVQRYWYVLDGQGNVVALTDGNGSVVDSYRYDLWGQHETASETVPQQLRYRGYWYDAELGWYWLGLRSYDPEGRFIQPDPTEVDGVFTYIYTGDDPVDFTDALGLFDCPSQNIQGTAHVFGWQHTFEVPGTGGVVHVACVAFDWFLRNQGIPGGLDTVVPLFNLLVGNDIHTALFDPSASPGDQAWAMVSLFTWIVPPAKLVKLVEIAAHVLPIIAKILEIIAVAARVHLAEPVFTKAAELLSKGRAFLERLHCTGCFPAGTQVATAAGLVGISTLQIGQTVLAENVTTGKVESEPVQAVIDDGVKPVILIDLSDGEAITVTADHPFYVDGGPLLHGSGWLEAGQLWSGDRLRSATGHDATVIAVHFNTGAAHVYTLTVAKDHSFFVGKMRVLVHNTGCPGRLFDKLGIRVSQHFRIRLAQRAGRGVSEYLALRAYLRGTLYFNRNSIIHDPETGRVVKYIRWDRQSGVAVAVTEPAGGKAVTVFQTNNPATAWLALPWRPGK